MSLDQILQQHKVIICAGSGGVGKTTMAAALGVRAAQLGLRTLVLTVDPAKRLATAMGLDLSEDHERKILGGKWSGELHAAVIDSRKIFDAFIARHVSEPEAADRILKNRLYQQLTTNLSGSQEFTSLERLLSAFESNRFDLIVLDTPPTKHAIDFLTAPQKIHSLFQDSMTQWFIQSTAPRSGVIGQLLNRGTRTVLKSLEVLTGGQFIEELIAFFAAIRSVQKTLRDRSVAVQKLLASAKTSFVVVTSFDAAKLEEAKSLQTILRQMGFHLSAVVINRAFPDWLKTEASAENQHEPTTEPRLDHLSRYFREFQSFHESKYKMYDEFAKGLGSRVEIIRIPEYDQDVHGMEDLEMLASRLANRGAVT